MNDDIKVFKPQRKFNLPQMPKVGPKMLMAATVTLALLAVVTAGLLTRKQSSKQFAPQQIAAATTATISDNFTGATIDPAKWTIVGTGVTQNNSLAVSVANSGVLSVATLTGDFIANVDTSLGSLSFTNAGTTYVQITRSANSIDSNIDGTINSFVVANSSTVIPIRIMRVGSNIQTFYNTSNTWNLLGSATTTYTSVGILQLLSTSSTPTANFDNFSAQVNLVGAPVPTPGTPAACTTQFTVLALAPTPTPSPTPLGASPTPTPTPTPTPVGASPTPTPTTTPATGCGFTCTNNVDCPSTMFCYVGVCRNPSCQTSASCVCSGTAPTPTPTPTPAPITKLTQAGSVLGTWTISLAGIIMVAFGALMLAF